MVHLDVLFRCFIWCCSFLYFVYAFKWIILMQLCPFALYFNFHIHPEGLFNKLTKIDLFLYFCGFDGKIRFTVLAEKWAFVVLDEKVCFCIFEWKEHFYNFDGNVHFTGLNEKCIFTVLAEKSIFTVLAEKCIFVRLTENVCFVVLAGNAFLRFWQEMPFCGFGGKIIFWRKSVVHYFGGKIIFL